MRNKFEGAMSPVLFASNFRWQNTQKALFVLLAFLSCNTFAQHETAFDIVDGKQAYQQVCANCHGPDGDLIANVDLGHGNFRQPYTDAELASIILKGIPETPMPPNPNMSEEQAEKIVAYLRSLAIVNEGSMAGDAERGKHLFEGAGECLSCHRVSGKGSGLGPELSRIGLLRQSAELEASLLNPQQLVQPDQRFYSVITDSGEHIAGRLLNHDAFTVQLLDSDEKLRSFTRNDLREYGFVESQMPSLQDDYSDQEIADLVEYLVSLKGEAQ